MKHTDLPIIGSTAKASFPELGLVRVPAKIDTGADSSAIWASNIKETSEGLNFELFGPASPFYTGQKITTKKYVMRSVKNSFGHSEFRYKVPLKVRLGRKTIAARFTLADRANNAYPILIGRRTLQGKFLVDVSKKPQAKDTSKPKRILVLVNSGGPSIRKFYEDLNEEYGSELHAEVTKYRDLAYYLEGDGLRIVNLQTDEELRNYDFIYFKTSIKNTIFASVIATYARANLVPYADEAAEQFAPTESKLQQLARLIPIGVTMPDTIYMSAKHMQARYSELTKRLGDPFVLKDNGGLKGRDNHLIGSKKELARALEAAEKTGLHMIAQRFIPNRGYYRVVVMGKQAVLVMYRSIDHKRSHLFSKAHDGPAELVKTQKLPGDVITMCITAADKLGWQIAGVDVLQDRETGKWYCLEVNNSPQLAGGAFIDKKRAALAAYFQEKA
jgi:glutathione synthase/RimK-type ligase-like ATP-grasp enzyme